jgi:hypothetical protein
MIELRLRLFALVCILVGVSSQGLAQNSISFGEVETGSITAAAQTNAYTFGANGLDVFDFTLVTTSGALVPKIQLFNSSGTLISSNNSGAPFGCSGSTVEMNTVQTPATGTYSVVVSDCSSTNTGDYALYMQRTNNPSGAENLPFGQATSGSIGSVAQSSTYSFSANQNDVVDFTVDTASGSLVPRIRLYNPNGTLNSSNNSGAPFGCSGSNVEMNTVTLPVTGTYTVLVADCSDTNTGGFEMFAQRTDNPASASALVFGQVQTGSVTAETQSVSFTLSANANDVLDFTMETTSGALVPKIRLYNPDGSLNSSNNSGAPFGCSGSSVEMNTVTLPTAGAYTILVGDCSDTKTGNFAIYSQRTNNPAGASNLPFGQVQTGLVGSVAQSYTYTFSDTANDVVDFTLVATNGSLVPRIRLYNPNGSLNSSNNSGAPFGCSGTTVEMNTVTLPTTGVYTVLVADCSDTNSGNFAIYMQSTKNPTAPTPVEWGQVQTGTLGSIAQSNTYTFSGVANNGVDFTIVTTSGNLVPRIRLYNPDGSLNSSNNSGAPFGCSGTTVQLNSITLAQTGNYTLLVADCNDANTGTYNLSSQCFGTCTEPETTLSLSAAPTFPPEPVGTTSPAQTFTVTNTGNNSLTFSAIAVSGPFAIVASGTTCSTSTAVAASGSCSVALTFTPTSVGTNSGSLTFTDNASASPQTVALTGTGTAAVITVTVSAAPTFPSEPVGITSPPETVTMTNTGAGNLTFTGVITTGPFAIAASGTTCSTSTPVAASTSCTVALTFTPTSVGTNSGSLAFTDNANSSPQTVTLTGTGAAPLSTTTTLVVNPTKAALGSLFTLTATVKDSNGNPLTNGSVTFYDAKAVLGIVQVVRTTSGGATIGTATLKTILVPLGANSLTAKYVGADASSSSAAVVATVTGTYSSSTSISDGGTPGDYTLTGTVVGAGPVSPTGDVTFTDTTTESSVGQATLNPATWTQTFVSAPMITGLSYPEIEALRDVNGDGKPDLFIASSTGLTVQLGNGDGTFQSPITILITSAPYRGLAFGDFDGDGRLDIAVSTGANITVLFGNGDGTFRTGPSYDSGTIADVAVGDFNGDGILDLAASNSDTVDLLLGNADGTFQTPITYSVASPSSLAVGDLNGDGISDLVAATSPGAVSVFLGNTNGQLEAGHTYSLQYQPGYMLLADFRGIGKLDLVTVFNQCCEGSDTAVNLMLGNGDGTFQSASAILSGINYSGAATGDFNGDGKLDLVVSDFGTPGINLLFGNADGTFQAPVSYPAGVGPITPAVADLNRDGRADIVVANYNDGTADVFLNQVTETATLANAVVFGTGQQSVTADYAGDTNFAASTSAAVMLTGTGTEPVAAVSSSTLTFAALLVKSTSSAETVTLSNTGNAALAIASISISGDFSQTNNCGSSVSAGGSCTINVTFAPTAGGSRSGTLTLTDNSDNSSGSTQTVALTGTGMDFTLTTSTSTVSVSQGQSATYTVSVGAVGGFNQAVGLTCTDPASESTCSISPSSQAPESNATVTVTTTAPSHVPPRTPPAPRRPWPQALPVLAMLLAWLAWAWCGQPAWTRRGLGRSHAGLAFPLSFLTLPLFERRRESAGLHWRSILLPLAASLALTLALAACGGGGGGTPVQKNPGTTPGNYTLTITGTVGSGSTADTHTLPLTLTVN